MAFIREYGAEAGDPFRFRLKKLKLGRFAGSLLRGVAGFVPGGKGALSLFSRLQSIGAKYGIHPDRVAAFARSMGAEQGDAFARGYGYDMGDPGAPRPQAKRKGAAAGPKAKAQKKAEVRARRRARGAGVPDIMGGLMEQAGKFFGHPGVVEGLGKVATSAAHAVAGAGASDEELARMMAGAPSVRGGGARGAKMRGHRRTVNPANVKALRRSMRRVEGFQKLVKRVEHAFPMMRRAHGATATRTRGHRSGCGCVVCKRRAA